MILHSGHTVRHVHGVEVVFSRRATQSWEEAGSVFYPVSARILRTHVKLHMGYATIIAVYVPTETKTTTTEAATEAEAFYSLPQATVSNAPKKDRVIIVGDFNARVGANTEQWGSVISHFGPREQNTNGISLLDLCTTHGLPISNTWFQHKQIHQLTWFSNGHRARPGHMYDYAIISRCLRTSLLDTRVFHDTQIDTDHELVVSTFCFKIKYKRHRNTWQLRKEETILNSTQHHSFLTTMKEALVMRHDRNQEDNTVEASWQSLKDALVEVEHGLPDLPSAPVQDRVSKEFTNLSRKKSEAWMRLHNAKVNNPNLPKLQQQYKSCAAEPTEQLRR